MLESFRLEIVLLFIGLGHVSVVMGLYIIVRAMLVSVMLCRRTERLELVNPQHSNIVLHESEPPSISRTPSPSIHQSDSDRYVAYLLCACWKVSD